MNGAKTKVMISCTITTQLICVFVFAYTDCCFSDVGRHIFTVFYPVTVMLQMKMISTYFKAKDTNCTMSFVIGKDWIQYLL